MIEFLFTLYWHEFGRAIAKDAVKCESPEDYPGYTFADRACELHVGAFGDTVYAVGYHLIDGTLYVWNNRRIGG